MNKRKRKGFTLVEMAVALGAAGTMAVVSAQEGSFETSQDKARALGNEVYQYNAGVSRYLVANASDSSVVGTHSGSDWLKGATCPGGLADKSYLSCDLIPNGKTLQYGSTPRTTITQDADGSLQARTVWDTVIGDEGKPDTMVMGIAALVASGNYVSQVGDAAAGYQSPALFCPETAGASAAISDACDTDRNAIVSLSSTNGSTDAWLRRDHGNTMAHVIEFDNGSGQPTTDAQLASVDGSNWRQMVNVSRIYNMGASGNDSLILGKMYGSALNATSFVSSYNLLQNSIVMDGNLGVMNDLYVRSNAIVNGDMQVENIHAKADILADGDIESKGNIVADHDITAGNMIKSLGSIESAGNVEVGGNLLTRGESTFDGVVRARDQLRIDGNLYAPRMIDSSNTSRFIDPSGTSNIENLNIRNNLYIDKKANEGTYCDTNGKVARKNDGQILSCVNKKWTASKSSLKTYGGSISGNIHSAVRHECHFKRGAKYALVNLINGNTPIFGSGFNSHDIKCVDV